MNSHCRDGRGVFFEALMRARGSNRLQNRMGLGRKALHPDPTQVCCNSILIFAVETLIFLPGSGSDTCYLIG